MAAGEEMEWVVALRNGMSNPAEQAVKSLRELTNSLRVTEKAADRLGKKRMAGIDALIKIDRDQSRAQQRAVRDAQRAQREMQRIQRGWETSARNASEGGGWSSMFAGLGGAAMVAQTAWNTVAGIAGTVANAGMQFGRFVFEAAQFHQNTITGLRTVLGTEQAANRVFAESQRIAELTPFDTDMVVQQRMNLVMGGFDEASSRHMQAALLDVGASGEGGEHRMQVLQDAVLRLHAQGELTNEVMQGIDAARVNRQLVFTNIAQALNIQTSNQRLMMRQVTAAISHHRVSAALGESAIQRAIQQTLDRNADGSLNPLGSFSNARGGTSLQGALSNLMSAPQALVSALDLENTAGGRGFREFLTSMGNLFSANSVTGKRLGLIVTDLVNGIGGMFGRLAQGDILQTVFMTGLDAVEALRRGVEFLAPIVQAFFGSFAEQAGLKDTAKGLRDLFATPPTETTLAYFRLLGADLGMIAHMAVQAAENIGRLFSTAALLGDVASMLAHMATGNYRALDADAASFRTHFAAAGGETHSVERSGDATAPAMPALGAAAFAGAGGTKIDAVHVTVNGVDTNNGSEVGQAAAAEFTRQIEDARRRGGRS